MSVKVYDVTGKLIKNQKSIRNNNYQLDMSGVTKGLYFFKN